MAQTYVMVRLPAELHARIKAIADADERTISWVIRNALDSWETPTVVSDAKELVRVSECPTAAQVALVEARRMVLGNVPRHLLSNTRVRAGLEEQVQQMMADGCDPRGIILSLQEWANRPDAYPGHLPHIYTELLKARSARPRSTVTDKVAGWLELGEQMTGEGR